ncbi:hypothetical protein AB0K00_19750 [Dactylosporangium sp. NPDC049525]|uniref:hypothetical protein n=1 Tax=Dactylosporangium sp. NPDC049525 TaxID=3154730 RepID=UPI003438E96A
MWRTPARQSFSYRVLAAAAILTICAGCTSESSPGVPGTPAARPPAGPFLAGTPTGHPGSPTAMHGSWDVSQLDDPCRTLTREEVVQVLAIPVNPALKVDSWPPVCAFGLTPGFGPLAPSDKPGVTEYFYILDDSAMSGREDFERGRSNPAVVESVAGIGDEAYWTPDKFELQVMSGRTHLTAKFSGAKPPADPKTKVIALARIALPRAKPQ